MKFQKKESIMFVFRQFVWRVDKKNYPKIYLEQCKYIIRKRQLVSFIENEIILSSDDSDE